MSRQFECVRTKAESSHFQPENSQGIEDKLYASWQKPQGDASQQAKEPDRSGQKDIQREAIDWHSPTQRGPFAWNGDPVYCGGHWFADK